MEVKGLIEDFKAYLTCSICLGYFNDPVIVKCGHNFCRRCLLQCSEQPGATLSCPECRGVIQYSDIVPQETTESAHCWQSSATESAAEFSPSDHLWSTRRKREALLWTRPKTDLWFLFISPRAQGSPSPSLAKGCWQVQFFLALVSSLWQGKDLVIPVLLG